MENPNDFVFDEGTRAEVEVIIRDLYANKHRARFFFGNTQTGRDWMEEGGTMGTVGKSTGIKPIPLLIATRRSIGGPALSTAVIVRIVDLTTGAELYRHPRYHTANIYFEPSDLPDYMIAARDQDNNGEVCARFKSAHQAVTWLAFMRGERHNKV